jgi:HSP20 family protein
MYAPTLKEYLKTVWRGDEVIKKDKKKDALAQSPSPTESGEITRRDPYSLWSDMDRMFDNFRSSFDDLFWTPSEGFVPRRAELVRQPLMDVEDTGKEYRVTLEMPGLKKDEVNIEATSTTLEITAQTSKEEKEEGKNFLRRERYLSRPSRAIELPEEVKTDSVEAEMKNGVLSIILPKREPTKAEKTKVNVK